MSDEDVPPPPAFDDDVPPPPMEDDDAPPPPSLPPPSAGGAPATTGPPPIKLKGPKSLPPPVFMEDGDHPSVINEYVSAILDMWGSSSASAFEGRDLTTTSPEQIATAVENAFFSPASLKRAMSYHPAVGDVVIASPPRTGQTPILTIVDQLLLFKPADEKAKADASGGDLEETAETLSGRIPWIESLAFDNIPPPPNVDGRRVFKTHLSLSALKMYMKPGVKYITVFRHPVDLRLSFFRHLRKIHIVARDQDNPQLFDDFYSVDDFVRVPIAPFQAAQSSGHVKLSAQSNKVAAELFDSPDAHVYEHEIVGWLNEERANPKQILIVFYEELIFHPEKLIQKIAQFLDAKRPDYERVSLMLKGWEYPQHIVDEARAAAAHRAMLAKAAASTTATAKTTTALTTAAANASTLTVKAPPHPPKEPKSAMKLPPGWKSAKDKSGETYYYNKVLDLVQWNLPTMDQATGDPSDTSLLALSCLSRGIKILDPDSVQYLDRVWDFCVTSNLNSRPDSYETLFLQIVGEPYPFGSRDVKKNDEEQSGKKGGRWLSKKLS